MKSGMDQVRDDLWFVFDYFPTRCLRHVLENRHRLIRKQYFDGRGNGCLFYLLSEQLAADQRIVSRETLTRFFTGNSGYPACEAAVYQPARWLVRLVDEQVCERVKSRYPGVDGVTWDYVIECIEQYLRDRDQDAAEATDTPADACDREPELVEC